MCTASPVTGLEAPQAEVQELIRELNIQFDNLCQFLPQDRVVSFARMDAYELLAATQKAIGDSTLYDQHQDLLQRRDEVRALDTVRRPQRARGGHC